MAILIPIRLAISLGEMSSAASREIFFEEIYKTYFLMPSVLEVTFSLQPFHFITLI